MKTLFVTGRHGFVGNIVVRAIASKEADERWEVADIDPAFDLRDAVATDHLVAAIRPDAVLHLAAQSAVPDSFRDPATTLQVNLMGTLNLLQSLRAIGFAGRFLYVGTGEVYGLVPEAELPIDEGRQPRPRNPYAVSKLAAEALCWQWYVSEGMDVVIARPFNHIGWGQSDRFAVSGFARQIAEIRNGTRLPVIVTGNLDVTRDFTDVNDVAEAYLALLARGTRGEVYNVCSGIEYRIGALLNRMLELAGVDARVEQDPGRMRLAEQRRMCGNPTKIRLATGWQPSTPMDRSLAAALDYWKGQIGNV